LVDRPGKADDAFPQGTENRVICFMCGDRQPFSAIAADAVPNLNMFSADAVQYVPYYAYPEQDARHDNITDWALKQFQQHYHPGRGRKPAAISKDAIFHYVYAVLHDPVYREKYALNLKREFPRIPLYGTGVADFEQWAAWGERLMALHIGYESVEPWPLVRTDTPDAKVRAAGQSPKCILRSEPDAGRIVIDSETVLAGVPRSAWDYRLGNRSAVDWVLDQHKERKPKDPTIREHFDTYRFADHKERVIDLLARVVRVSVETVAIIEMMKGAPR
jgi:predicted helicase